MDKCMVTAQRHRSWCTWLYNVKKHTHWAVLFSDNRKHCNCLSESVEINIICFFLQVKTTLNLKLFSSVQVLYKVYISFVEVGVANVLTADYFKGVGECTENNTICSNFRSSLTHLTLPPQPPSSSSASGGLWWVWSLPSSWASSLVSPRRFESSSHSLSSCWSTWPTWPPSSSPCPPFCRKFVHPLQPEQPPWPVLLFCCCLEKSVKDNFIYSAVITSCQIWSNSPLRSRMNLTCWFTGASFWEFNFFCVCAENKWKKHQWVQNKSVWKDSQYLHTAY